ncbi:3-isopropylmalate/(R)-2-methylmalate dehydratase small subunit [Sulfitobacter marinus]|uniref:3-isopropylmalate dehydratase n=1 Tax=Sulfitobacter marinus TaxID=394264 RepID=A0A1I6R0C6_9RHOB|nr:3-isopropylmalate dehydratase small subunit [Sulfitobacter marinus]SFS58114.1 3-isopropylmalate/(R)-2-methylmalate dehydratase small subunit [Sulfitobacter marinus]
MEKLDKLTGIAVPILENNIDTDVIFPARFLLIADRDGLGKYAFHERKRHSPDFALNQPQYANATFLVAGKSFGTGSSREQAVWAIADLGVRCVIARSFGEIFFANCFKNGVLPIVCAGPEMAKVEAAAIAGQNLSLNLSEQIISLPDCTALPFDISSYNKRALLSGLDEAGMILQDDIATIEAYEKQRDLTMPWLSLTKTATNPASKMED